MAAVASARLRVRDYADAGLVVLAHAMRIDTVFTTDRKGFSTYRRARDRGFELFPVW